MQVQKNVHFNLLPIVLALLGIGSIIYGVSRGEAPVMFEKAINICLECIGIG